MTDKTDDKANGAGVDHFAIPARFRRQPDPNNPAPKSGARPTPVMPSRPAEPAKPIAPVAVEKPATAETKAPAADNVVPMVKGKATRPTPQGPAPAPKPAPIETPKAKTEPIAALTETWVPAALFATATLCAADAKATREALKGVHIHSVGETLRMVATDGARMIVLSRPVDDGALPDWLKEGVTIPAQGLKTMLGFLASLKIDDADTIRVAFAKGASRIELSNVGNTALFRLPVIALDFPEYQKIIDTATGAFLADDRKDFDHVAMAAGYLKGVGEIAKSLGCENVRVFTGTNGSPTVITFPNDPGAVLYQAGIGQGNAPIFPEQTRAMLGSAINGTVAALRAHRTRTAEALKAAATPGDKGALEAKLADYDRRIADAVQMARLGLPKPKEAGADADAPKAAAKPTPKAKRAAKPAKAKPRKKGR